MLRVAVIYEESNKVFIAFEPETFTKLLEGYYQEHKSIKKAMKAIEVDLKKKTMYK